MHLGCDSESSCVWFMFLWTPGGFLHEQGGTSGLSSKADPFSRNMGGEAGKEQEQPGMQSVGGKISSGPSSVAVWARCKTSGLLEMGC